MSQPRPSTHPTLSATAPTEEERFYLAWARDTLQHNLTYANEVLRQLVSLASTMLGGSIVFLDTAAPDPSWRTAVSALFFASLCTALVGILPYEEYVALNAPAEIRRHKAAALRWKRIYLWSSAGLLLAGFALALLGLAL
jgi:hypothetical protein